MLSNNPTLAGKLKFIEDEINALSEDMRAAALLLARQSIHLGLMADLTTRKPVDLYEDEVLVRVPKFRGMILSKHVEKKLEKQKKP